MWRRLFRPIVAELVEMIRTCHMTDRDAAREFRAAWRGRWGPRQYWPYKVWRDEIARQMGWKHGRMRPRGSYKSMPEWARHKDAEALGQLKIEGT